MRAIHALVGIALAMFVVPAVGAVVIVDNSDPEAVFTGTWTTSTSTAGFYGPNYYHNNQQAGLSGTYTPDLPTAGTWTVWARWTDGGNRRTDVPYTINYDGGSQVMIVNQETGGGLWYNLGDYSFQAGTAGNVVLGVPAAGEYVIADAVAFSMGVTTDTGYIDPTTLTAYASTTISSSNRAPSQAVNGAGMDDSLETFHVATNNGENVNWMSDAGDTAGWFEVDLGAEYLLGSMKVWNFTSTNRPEREVQSVDVYVSTALTPGSHNYATDPDWTLVLDDVLFSQIPAGPNSSPELLDFGPSGVNARWVALDILSNYGDNYTGLGELRFYALQVPEPGTVAAALSGLLVALGLGWFRRTRR